MSKGLLGALAAVVVVIVVLLTLLFANVIPGLHLGSSGGGGGGGASGPSYNVTFTESGLPSGTSWSVTISGSTVSSITTSLTFSKPNGTYAYTVSPVAGYKATPNTGSVTVSGAAASQSIAFTVLPPGSYTVTFTESGLPGGTSWSVTFNGTAGSSATSTIAFTIGNGTWPFTVGSVTGYSASPASGNVAVSGAAASQGVTFTSNGGGGGGGAQTFSQAKPAADSTVSGHSTSAVLWVAYGIDSRSAYTNSSTNVTKSNCTLTGGSATTVTVPTFSGNYHSGVSPAWLFGYYQPSPQALFLVAVLNGAGTYLGEVTGASCFGTGYGNVTLASNPVDSPVAGSAAAGTTNGSTFVAAHSQADAIYPLVGGVSVTYGNYTYSQPSAWIVEFSTCSAGYTGPGSYVTTEVNASSGAVMVAGPIQSTNCSGSPVLVASGGNPVGPVGTPTGLAGREMMMLAARE